MNNRNFHWVLSITFMVMSYCAIAQNGIIRGTVYDGETGETMPGVNVVIVGTTNGSVTDLDGKFNISAAPGTYNLGISFISFASQVITDVVVEADKVNSLGDIIMKTDAENLQEVVISATVVRDNETAMLTMKRLSTDMIDGISEASFRKIGDSDAASSAERVPGVTVEGGKYVYVRGLGDRYTKTTLNGLDLPGLDPDRNTIQLDIFPTSVLSNIVVHKTFIAGLPADFTGGVVDIETKAFPEEKTRSISVSLGYNPNFHFRNDFLTYEGGSTDFLGFDDGTRDIPATTNIPQFAEVVGNPNGTQGQRYQDILRSFSPYMAAIQKNSLMDYSFGASAGDQIVKEKLTLGYNFVFNYKKDYEYYEEAKFGRYGLNADPTVFEMETRELQTGSFGSEEVLISGLASFAVKSAYSKYRFSLLHLQNAESRAGIFDYLNADQGAIFLGYQHNLEFSQRSLTNFLVSGEHNFENSKWNLEWKVAPTISAMDDPDVRFTRYERRGEDLVIGTEAGFPQRIWRELSEIGIANNLEVKRDYKLFERDAEIDFGGNFTYKTRDYNIRSFNINVRDLDLTGDPDELFQEENLWPVGGNVGVGTTFDAIFLPTNPNEFTADIRSTAAFVSTGFELAPNLETTIGVRMENYQQFYTGQDQLGANILLNEKVLDDLSLFPSVNFVYHVNERQNLRAAYSQTVARPSMKELSYAEIYDPLTGRTFIGGLFRDADDGADVVFWDGNLTQTDIQNVDLRWELFPTPQSTISFGGFYKFFKNPIEIIQFATQANAFQPRNVGDGEIFGGEVEVRQSLKFITEKLSNFTVSANFTAIESRIQLSATELKSRQENKREGQEISEYRNMAGQAPLVVNAGISFEGSDEGFGQGLEAGVYYHVQSSTLTYVGIVDRPDIYSVPFHSLNFNANKRFGEDDKFTVGLSISNILNDKKEYVFQSFGAEDQFLESLAPGTAFGVKFGYTF
jgi:hypothetical protein